MDHNGNLNYAERRALRPGDRVVYQTEALAHRGEMAGTVARVGESGIVYIGKHGARDALLSDFVRRADWPGEAEQPAGATPEPARRAKAPKPGKDTPRAPDAPAGQETRSSGVYGPTLVTDPETGLMMAPAVALEALRARVEALTKERDEARRKLKLMMMAAVALIETAKAVCDE